MKAAVLTVSDGVNAGVREDTSGDVLEELLREEGYAVARTVVPDDADVIATAIRSFGDAGVELILTTGGTGFAPRDVTPEATRVVIEAAAETTAQTGVEMEALTAVAVAGLTVYDMAKAIDKEMRIDDVVLVSKTKEPA